MLAGVREAAGMGGPRGGGYGDPLGHFPNGHRSQAMPKPGAKHSTQACHVGAGVLVWGPWPAGSQCAPWQGAGVGVHVLEIEAGHLMPHEMLI